MGETSVEIEQHIEETRDQLGEDLSELQSKVKDATDWRYQFRNHPKTALGIAFGGGMVLGMVGGGSASRSSNSPSYSQWTEREPTSQIPETQYGGHKRSEACDNFKSALIGVAISKCEHFLEELLPGFTDQHRRAKLETDQADRASRAKEAAADHRIM